MKIFSLVFSVLVGSVFLDSLALADCADLLVDKFADTEITSVEPVAQGAFTAPRQFWAPPAAILHELPAFCRVVGVIRPTADSAIGFELWLPIEWNGRLLQ